MLLPLDPAAPGLVAALENDPFYRSISTGFEPDVSAAREALAGYFTYSISEASALGRCVRPSDPSLGVATWLLPVSPAVHQQVAAGKRAFLHENLSPAGARNYDRIIEFMHAKSATVVAAGAWYLSIVAVAPTAQGRGLGQQLLAPTLTEADARGAVTYLETFTPRNLAFYQRLGFSPVANFHEPTSNSDYHLLTREPVPPR